MAALSLYEKYHTSRSDERRGLFEAVRAEFGGACGLYPGCFVHVTPSFVFPEMHYVDSDRNARRFFTDGSAEDLVERHRSYEAPPRVRFHFQDYREGLPVADGSLDILISQYAGPVSDHCSRYLARGGHLIANNSHGDAGIVACDPAFRLVAVVHRREERWTLSTLDLDAYFIPKSEGVPDDQTARAEHIRHLGRGLGYTRTASDYVFERVT